MAQSEGLLSKGIKLSYGSGTSQVTYTVLDDLLEIPDMGGSTDSVEVTTLMDSAHRYIKGLRDYGDSLDFILLYSKSQFDTLNGFADTVKSWKVEIPTDTASPVTYASCTFTGACSVKINGVSNNDAIKMTLSIKPNSAMTWA